jgi:hypothetical protein
MISSRTNAILSQKEQLAISAFREAMDSQDYTEEQINWIVGKFRAFKNYQRAVNKAKELSPTIEVYSDINTHGNYRNDSILIIINDNVWSAPVNKPFVKGYYYERMNSKLDLDTANRIAQYSEVITTTEEHVLFVEDSFWSGYKTLCFFHNGVKYKLFG